MSVNWIELFSVCRKIDSSNWFFERVSTDGFPVVGDVGGGNVVGGLDADKIKQETKYVLIM